MNSYKNPFKLIGLTGLAKHGKDSAAKVLIEKAGFQRLAFADGVRDVALAIDPLICLEYDQFSPRFIRLSELVQKRGWDDAKKHPEIRRTLQRVGTEAGRDIFGANVWVDRVASMCSSYDCVVITDVRFPNEAEWLASAGGELWRVERPNFDNEVSTDHPSEAFVMQLRPTRIILNDGTLSQLEEKVQALLI